MYIISILYERQLLNVVIPQVRTYFDNLLSKCYVYYMLDYEQYNLKTINM
jgi:hypothetical protein